MNFNFIGHGQPNSFCVERYDYLNIILNSKSNNSPSRLTLLSMETPQTIRYLWCLTNGFMGEKSLKIDKLTSR